MATSPAVDTNVSSLPAEDQARTDITTSGKTTTVTVTGSAPLKDLVVETNTLAPSLTLEGNFKNCDFVGGATVPERFAATGKVQKSVFKLGNDSFKDVVKLKSAKKVTLADFKDGDKLKYKGRTYKFDDIIGKGFDGLSKKEIKLA